MFLDPWPLGPGVSREIWGGLCRSGSLRFRHLLPLPALLVSDRAVPTCHSQNFLPLLARPRRALSPHLFLSSADVTLVPQLRSEAVGPRGQGCMNSWGIELRAPQRR